MKYLTILLILLGGFYYGLQTNGARVEVLAQRVRVVPLKDWAKEEDIEKIRKVTAGSPMESYAEEVYKAAKHWGMDWRILLGIARLESSFFRKVPENCNNGFGLGIYKGSKWCYPGFTENIWAVAKHWNTDRRYLKHDDLVIKGCVWQRGRAEVCPYGLKLKRLVETI